jgi:CheY-like chemotaxis protein
MIAGKRVLVVEDEAIVSMMIEDYLKDFGCNVVGTAARINEAIEMARTLDLDVVVLDVNLAGTLSYPVADILRSRGIPFLFSTGYGSAGLPEHLKDAIVLSKPYAPEALAIALLSVLSARLAIEGI